MDEGGEAAVTLRAVARRLGVTPMAVAHRTGGRDGLLAQIVAAAHADLEVPSEAGPADAAALTEVLLRYAATARRHPGAVTAIFARPDVMPPMLARLSAWVRHQLGLRDPERAEEGLALLVDYIHGHLLAAAAAPQDNPAADQILRENVVRLAAWLLGEETCHRSAARPADPRNDHEEGEG
jgi:AcrR family transcriptional regulator